MAVPTPPATGPDEIDNALFFQVDSGRVATWLFAGHVKLRGAAYGQHQEYSGQFSATYDRGYIQQGTSSSGDYPYSVPYAEFDIGIYTIRFGLDFQLPSYANRYYRKGNVTDGGAGTPYGYFLHDSDSETYPNSDPSTGVGGAAAVDNVALPTIGSPALGYLGNAPIASFCVFPTGPFTPPTGPVQAQAAGLKYTFTNNLTSAVTSGQVNNNGTESARFAGPTTTGTSAIGFPNHLGEYLIDHYTGEHGPNTSLTSTFWDFLAVIDIDDDFTISVDVKEVFKSYSRGSGEYQWLPITWTVTCGSATFTFTDPDPQPMDSTMQARVGVMQHQDTSFTLGTFAGWGYTPDWFAEVSDWNLSGTQAGTDFAGLGGTASSVIDDGGTVGCITGTLTASSIKVQFAGSADTPTTTTIGGHSYTWYVTAPFNIITGGPGNVASGRVVLLDIFPVSTNTISLDERWYDGTAFDRDPANAIAIAWASYLTTWNNGIAASGTAFGIVPIPNTGQPSAILGPSGFVLGSIGDLNSPFVFAPADIAYVGTGFDPRAHPWPEWFIAETSTDPFDTNIACCRSLGSLTLTVTQRVLPSISLSVSSDSMGGSNTDVFTTSTGNWSANRYLKVTCSSISLTGGDRATLTFRSNGHDLVYTLRPDSMTGIAIVDLTAPDDFSLPSFGVGIGLYNPVPVMVTTAGTATTYSRVTTDISTPNSNNRVGNITLTVPGPLETFTAVIEFDTPHLGFDSWTDPLGDGEGYAWQVARAHDIPLTTPYHQPYLGALHILVDGKPAVTHPYYAHWPFSSPPPGTVQDYWDIPMMVSDVIYTLSQLANGIAGTFSPASNPTSSIPITADNCPLGLIWGNNSPYGSTSYLAWSGGTATFEFRRKLTRLTFTNYCATYTLVGSKLHGGGLEGIAYDRSTRQALVSSSIDITHHLSTAGLVPPVRDSTNYPTGTVTVPTDATGRFRDIFYDQWEAPTIKHMVNPIPSFTIRPPYIRELAYNHFAVLISTKVPGVTNLAPLDGSYHVAGPLYDSMESPAGIQYSQAYASDPSMITIGGGSFPVVITPGVTDGNPSLALDSRMRLYCAFERDGAGVWTCFSDDDGETWSDPIMAIAGGTNPVIRIGKDGSMITCAYVDGGSGDAGVIKGYWQPTPDGVASTLTTFKDQTGADIPVQPGQFGLDQGAESGARWFLAVLVVTETAPSTWGSADDAGFTFVRLV